MGAAWGSMGQRGGEESDALPLPVFGFKKGVYKKWIKETRS